MINMNKLFLKFLNDLKESSPNLNKSLKEISPINFCININGHRKIYITIDDESNISFEQNSSQFEIRGSLIELLNLLATRKLNKNLIFGDTEQAIIFANIILKSNIDIVYLIDKYFGDIPALLALSTIKLFKTSDNNFDNDYESIRRRLREVAIKLDRLEALKRT